MPAVATTDTFQSTTPSSTQDVESMVRACMAAIIPTTEETCREIITRQSELPSAATRSGPAATVTASSIPEDTSAEGSHYGLQPAQSLLQDITGISSSLQTSRAPEHVQTCATLLTLGVDDKLRAKIHAGEGIHYVFVVITL